MENLFACLRLVVYQSSLSSQALLMEIPSWNKGGSRNTSLSRQLEYKLHKRLKLCSPYSLYDKGLLERPILFFLKLEFPHYQESWESQVEMLKFAIEWAIILERHLVRSLNIKMTWKLDFSTIKSIRSYHETQHHFRCCFPRSWTPNDHWIYQ